MSVFARTALTAPRVASDERARPAARLLIVEGVADNRAALSSSIRK